MAKGTGALVGLANLALGGQSSALELERLKQQEKIDQFNRQLQQNQQTQQNIQAANQMFQQLVGSGISGLGAYQKAQDDAQQRELQKTAEQRAQTTFDVNMTDKAKAEALNDLNLATPEIMQRLDNQASALKDAGDKIADATGDHKATADVMNGLIDKEAQNFVDSHKDSKGNPVFSFQQAKGMLIQKIATTRKTTETDSLAAQKAKADAAKAEADAQIAKINATSLPMEKQADFQKKLADAAKASSESNKTAFQNVYQPDQMRVINSMKDGPDKDQARQAFVEATAHNADIPVSQAAGLISAAAMADMDERAKTKFANDIARDASARGWRSLQIDAQKAAAAASKGEDGKPVSEMVRKTLDGKYDLATRGKELSDKLNKMDISFAPATGKEVVKVIGTALDGITHGKGITDAMNRVDTLTIPDDQKEAIRDLMQLSLKIVKEQTGAQATDSERQAIIDAYFPRRNDIVDLRDSARAAAEKFTQDYNRDLGVQKELNVKGLSQYAPIELGSYKGPAERKAEQSAKQQQTLQQRDTAISQLDPSSGQRMYGLIKKNVGEDPIKQTNLLNAVINAQKAGQGTDVKFLLELGNVDQIIQKYGSMNPGNGPVSSVQPVNENQQAADQMLKRLVGGR